MLQRDRPLEVVLREPKELHLPSNTRDDLQPNPSAVSKSAHYYTSLEINRRNFPRINNLWSLTLRISNLHSSIPVCVVIQVVQEKVRLFWLGRDWVSAHFSTGLWVNHINLNNHVILGQSPLTPRKNKWLEPKYIVSRWFSGGLH